MITVTITGPRGAGKSKLALDITKMLTGALDIPMRPTNHGEVIEFSVKRTCPGRPAKFRIVATNKEPAQ